MCERERESTWNIKSKLEHTKITVLCSNIYVSIQLTPHSHCSHSRCHKYFIAFHIMLQKTIFSSASFVVARESLILWNEKVFMLRLRVRMRNKVFEAYEQCIRLCESSISLRNDEQIKNWTNCDKFSFFCLSHYWFCLISLSCMLCRGARSFPIES